MYVCICVCVCVIGRSFVRVGRQLARLRISCHLPVLGLSAAVQPGPYGRHAVSARVCVCGPSDWLASILACHSQLIINGTRVVSVRVLA